MDLSAIIVVVLLAGAFFGFIVWMATLSRRTGAEKIPADAPNAGLKKE